MLNAHMLTKGQQLSNRDRHDIKSALKAMWLSTSRRVESLLGPCYIEYGCFEVGEKEETRGGCSNCNQQPSEPLIRKYANEGDRHKDAQCIACATKTWLEMHVAAKS